MYTWNVLEWASVNALSEYIPLSSKLHVNTYTGLSVLFQSCKLLRTVQLRRCSQVNDDCVEVLAMNCPHLSSLNISGCTEVTDQALEYLSVNCRTIQSLDLSRTKVCYSVQWCVMFVCTGFNLIDLFPQMHGTLLHHKNYAFILKSNFFRKFINPCKVMKC